MDLLSDLDGALAFLEAHAVRHFQGRIPGARRWELCAATVLGEEGRRIDVAGVGATRAVALAAAAGEAAETLSQIGPRPELTAGEGLPRLTGGWLDAVPTGGRTVAGRLLGTGGAVALPAGLVLRGGDRTGLPPASEGCAAGPSLAAASLAAVLELIERDAVARWLRGGRPARRITRTTSPREGRIARCVHLLDLGYGALAPVAGLVSHSTGGADIIFAAAARARFAEARAAAERELVQFELAPRAAEPGASGDVEALLGPPAGSAARSRDLPAPDAGARLAGITERAAGAGIRIALVDLTRPDLSVPVVKAVSPDLAPSRPPLDTETLRRDRARFGPPDPDRARRVWQ